MKREGRQQGMESWRELNRVGRQQGLVRCEMVPSSSNSLPNAKVISDFDAPTMARFYTKVSSKPTNRSKFIGKCGRPQCMGCHIHPVCKSRDKAKGTQKIKSSDVASNHRSIAWRTVDKGVRQNYSGISATGLLSHLSGVYREDMDDGIDDENDHDNDDDDDDDDDDAEGVGEERSNFDDGEDGTGTESIIVRETVEIDPSPIEIEDDEEEEEDDDDDDDDMGFYAVGNVWDIMDDDEDWCLVGEM